MTTTKIMTAGLALAAVALTGCGSHHTHTVVVHHNPPVVVHHVVVPAHRKVCHTTSTYSHHRTVHHTVCH